jgi:hypothetical protein
MLAMSMVRRNGLRDGARLYCFLLIQFVIAMEKQIKDIHIIINPAPLHVKVIPGAIKILVPKKKNQDSE